MEFIDGQDIEAIINRVPDFLPLDMVCQWAVELCDVLEYLHTHQPEPIIFRDVKPSNIMIDKHNKVRLIDFGIAKTFQVNQKGTMIGTEGYAPPEQYRGEASPQGDIYAAGATLHHIMTKRDPRLEPPFTFNDRPIRQSNANVSPELEAVVMRALAQNVQDRFQTSAAMKDAIEGAIRPAAARTAARPGAAAAAADEAFAEAGKITALWKFKCEDEIRS